MRYATTNNFVGQKIDDYGQTHAILSKPTAEALANVPAELRAFGLGLKVFDAYRPQRTVDHFVHWGKDLKDVHTKSDYYPDVSKGDLFKEGYVASRSSHSRGSTVDVTIVSHKSDRTKEELDMGSGYEFFSDFVARQQGSHTTTTGKSSFAPKYHEGVGIPAL